MLVWNPQTGEKLRSILIEANGGTHYVDFSPTKKQIVTGSIHFDRQNDTGSTSIALTYPLTGVTEWQRSMPGWVKPVFTPDGGSIAALSVGQLLSLIDVETGQLKHDARLADAAKGAKWNDFAFIHNGRAGRRQPSDDGPSSKSSIPQESKLAVGGIDAEGRGFVIVRPMGDESTPQPKQSAGTR